MPTRRVISMLIALVVIVGGASVARADQPQASLSPDRILKGTAPTVTITLDKSVPDQNQIKGVRIVGQVLAVQEPKVEGKLVVQLPKLDMVGRADVELIGKDDKPFLVGQLTYVEAAEPARIPGYSRDLVLLLVYVGLLVLLPVGCTIYDIRKSYQERNKVLKKLMANATVQDIGTLFSSMDRGPTGFTGLTRGLLALTLILVIGFAVFHLVVFAPAKLPDVADKLLMLVAGTLTAITGFYFGSKAATEAAQQTPAGKAGTSVVPKITDVAPPTGAAGTKLTVKGEGFGKPQGKGTVKIGTKDANVTTWDDTQIEVAVPGGLNSGNVTVVVTIDDGRSSNPGQFKVV